MKETDVNILDVTLPLFPELLMKLIPICLILVFSIISFNRNKKWYTLFQVNGAIIVFIDNASFLSSLLCDIMISSHLAVFYLKFLMLVNSFWFPVLGWALFAIGYSKMILEANKNHTKPNNNKEKALASASTN